MYSATLLVHSWLRWAVIATALIAILGGIIGVARRGQWTPADDRAGFWFITTLDLQLLLGLALYFFLSPFTTEAMKDFGAAMKTPGLRFWAVEHIMMMFIAVIAVHVGRVLSRKAPTPEKARARLFMAVAIATAAMVAGIPWPGTAAGRPL